MRRQRTRSQSVNSRRFYIDLVTFLTDSWAMELLTPRQAASRLALSYSTVKHWIHTGTMVRAKPRRRKSSTSAPLRPSAQLAPDRSRQLVRLQRLDRLRQRDRPVRPLVRRRGHVRPFGDRHRIVQGGREQARRRGRERSVQAGDYRGHRRSRRGARHLRDPIVDLACPSLVRRELQRALRLEVRSAPEPGDCRQVVRGDSAQRLFGECRRGAFSNQISLYERMRRAASSARVSSSTVPRSSPTITARARWLSSATMARRSLAGRRT